MKALLIAEEEEILKPLKAAIQKSGAETIVYRWLLKALDNVEEIAPDVVVISTAEYPRHWKTFVQFTKSGIGGVVPKVILYNSRPMNDDEKSKARSLGVFGMINSLDKDSLEELTNYIIGKKSSDFAEESGTKLEFIFTNPQNNCLVTGKVKKYSQGRIEFTSDSPSFVQNLKVGDTIKRATFGQDKLYKSVAAKVLSNGKILELKLT
ncbi:MAG: hypothetical protein K6A42_08885 [Treponema sp.]|nr:hypothetical protein [Treponema sp.]